ncbi:hypothetical protein [Streptantibioticus ferralitis]|uniref:Integral membrane protein n=1 Tax=Streptantibioticus ferralitis TaxID=236510 RepID=A0ABT5YSR5_9ACTN|nr:hypothetical protein [Streptantibioticus ferralitis]MDF2254647.1 hypothetical protein [Streptantibioticus ferralitis]
MTEPCAVPDPAEPSARRRGPADPVLVLIRRHYELCATAVDPLEIAAGLEAHGVTDRTAASYRHRDVFSLAEELYARVPHESPAEVQSGESGAVKVTARQVGVHLLPGVICAMAIAAAHTLDAHPARAAVIGGGAVLLVIAAARAALRRGPLRAATTRGTAWWICWLLAFALYGPRLLMAQGGPGGLLDPAAAAGFLARALALLPAAWCARRFALRARAVLADSHGLTEFAAGVRPLLLATLGLFTVALSTLLAVAYPVLAPGARPDLVALGGSVMLGVLLFTAQLLAVHGFPAAAAAGTGGACAVEAVALAAELLRHVPALRPLGAPSHALIAAGGPGSVQAVACTAAALALTGYAMSVLGRACAHGSDRATAIAVPPALADRAVVR